MSRRAATASCLALAASALLASPSAAEGEGPEEPVSVTEARDAEPPEPELPPAEPPEEARPPRRPLPDYDGRPPPPPSPGDRAVFIPRILFYPLYAFAEYVLRPPAKLLFTHLEPGRVVQFFRLGPNERVTLAPVFSYDLGFRPQIGLLLRARRIGVPGHSISAQGAFGGPRWYAGRLTEAYRPPGSRVAYDLMAEGISRPDGLFYGIGGDVKKADRSHYHWIGAETSVGAGLRLFGQTRATFRTGYRFRHFDDDVGSRLTIPEAIAQGAPYGLPPGYPEGYSLWFTEARAEIDTRPDRPAPGDGLRLTIDATGAVDLRNGPSALSFFVYGASLGGYLDLSGANHVLSLTGTVVFSDAVRGAIPFTELPTLSGYGPMNGFLKPFLIADSGAALSAVYTWPIWVYLDGRLDLAVGNGFNGHLDDFSMGKLRLSASLGIAAVIQRVHFLEVGVGIGTDEFRFGPNVEQVRFVVGATRGF